MANVRPEQLAQACKRGLAPVYVISGDEPLLVQEACDTIRTEARAQGFSERELYHSDTGIDWEGLMMSANSLSLFAERKIIEIRLHNGKPKDEGAKALTTLANSGNPDTLLLILTPKLEANTKKTKWFKALDSVGTTVAVWPINAEQLPSWIDRRLRQAGLKADSQAIDVLANRVEGNLLAASQEIEKLKLLVGDSKLVTAELMLNAVGDSARFDVFNLVDKALMGDGPASTRTLQGLRGEGVDATIVLWALAREIRTLHSVQESVNNGIAFDRACQANRIWDIRKGLIRMALPRLPLPILQQLLRKAHTVDKAIKGIRRADPWPELMDLCLDFAGTKCLHPKIDKLLSRS
ncbi:DNA polymerase III subunit delta [Marinibactrum halimedae]|uniref:DNA polymerase III subunit delta n=1 Tax=Marinibactrum halimedae TaxID=1444977 RepID=A0AA37WLX8_9GAMM|nr:DNA polymerase III subunit delta [Marinibactrum halimedae]MCD9457399.1 DNA polymerase III subunit delta [Marinibactrum halimedae]GLS25550.1 DNA polymerase III subunit delta [Marinibactrum halimedae]